MTSLEKIKEESFSIKSIDSFSLRNLRITIEHSNLIIYDNPRTLSAHHQFLSFAF